SRAPTTGLSPLPYTTLFRSLGFLMANRREYGALPCALCPAAATVDRAAVFPAGCRESTPPIGSRASRPLPRWEVRRSDFGLWSVHAPQSLKTPAFASVARVRGGRQATLIVCR